MLRAGAGCEPTLIVKSYEFRIRTPRRTVRCGRACNCIIWTESLDGLQIVTGEEAFTVAVPPIPYITLYWAGRKRKLILHNSLKKALETQPDEGDELPADKPLRVTR